VLRPLRPLPRAATTRRTAIGAAVAGLAVASGCDASRGGHSAGPGVSAAEHPDVTLVGGLVSEITDLAGLVSAVATTYPRLAPTMRPFGELHAAHLEVLGAEAPTGAAERGSFAGPAAADRVVRRREQRLQRRLADGSVAARSGDLARVLACMSAGAAQLLARWRPEPAGQGDG
jgi:hypothetical protein